MVAWIFRYSDGAVQHLCDACGRTQAAHLQARLPHAHEHGATTRKGTRRGRWTVTVLRAPQTDEWLYSVHCAQCTGPTTDEINHFLKTGD